MFSLIQAKDNSFHKYLHLQISSFSFISSTETGFALLSFWQLKKKRKVTAFIPNFKIMNSTTVTLLFLGVFLLKLPSFLQ